MKTFYETINIQTEKWCSERMTLLQQGQVWQIAGVPLNRDLYPRVTVQQVHPAVFGAYALLNQ
jgi:hypothetical protein